MYLWKSVHILRIRLIICGSDNRKEKSPFICGHITMKEFYKGDITYKIIGCAMNVHNELGCGFQEVIYQRALFMEFRKAGLRFEREKTMEIWYQGVKIGTRRVDFLVDSDIMLEIKATTKIEDVNKAQLMNYIEVYKVRIGLLINFGNREMEYYRFIKYLNSSLKCNTLKE